MRRFMTPFLALFALASPTVCLSATAPNQIQQHGVLFGTSWDGPANELQLIIDTVYGPGFINVTTDYLGAEAGEPDPFFWLGNFSALLVREIAGNANRNELGWYIEDGSFPVIDGNGDGVVFSGPDGTGETAIVSFTQPLQRFGFYLDPNGAQSLAHAPQGEYFFTNRTFNDQGPDGGGAIHTPSGGDVQALVFDISARTQPNTFLVCFEDLDSGQMTSACCTDTDNDFNDLVFEVTALGATPVQHTSFGALNVRYR
jgi:hypothetical protein